MTTPRIPLDGPPTSPVAVIGLACRLPGEIDSPQRLWDALLRGTDLVGEIPADRWDADSYCSTESATPGGSVSRWGAFLADVGAFDAEFFGMTDADATAIDPQHRLLLETSWEAAEHAGLDPASLAGSRTGVFVGLDHSDYEQPGTGGGFAPGRVARALGLHGPAVTVDTAGSSGLMAVHQACRSLQTGESDLVLAGGVSVLLEPRRSVAGSARDVWSPTGRCRAFDAAADGSVSGEGCVVLLLKRLPDALRDDDRVLAVLRGSAANHDGGSPSDEPSAQVAVYRDALAAANLEAATVGLVEADGAGTAAADRLEYTGLAEVYGTAGRCFLGSATTNFGHCQSAAGPLGLAKAILAVQHGTVPRNLHFSALPDQLAAMGSNLTVPQENMPWPATEEDRPRRAAVSSHGCSGTNVHVIVEQAPEPAGSPPDAAPVAGTPQLFPISANSPEQLRATAARLAEWLDQHGAELTGAGSVDLGYTLARRRAHRPVRTAIAAEGIGELGDALRDLAGDDKEYRRVPGPGDRGPVWVFTGQGLNWTAIGLLAADPTFEAAIAELEPLVAAEAGFSLAAAISAPQPPTDIVQRQVTVFATQVGLARAMTAHGVRPGAVIGHSLGETAAAVVAGGLAPEDGVRVVCRRAQLLAGIAGSGAMAALELPAQQVLSEFSIRDITDVVLAVVDAPVCTTIGGSADTVRDLVAAWQQQGVPARELAVDVAAHSPQVEPILDELTAALADLRPTEPQVPYYSATLWAPRDRPAFDADYWVENLRYTARFAAAVQAAIKDGHRVFAAPAADPQLTDVIERNAAGLDAPVTVLAPMLAGDGTAGGCGLLGFVADLHGAGAAVDFAAHYPVGRLVDAPLPRWDHRSLLLRRDSGDTAPQGAAVRAVHPLLGSHVHLWEEPERHVWAGDVGLVAHPWLADHLLYRVPTLPGAAYCEMALAAARAGLGEGAQVRDLRFEQVLPLEEQTALSSGAVVTAPGVLTFGVHTHHDRMRVDRATAVLESPDNDRRPPVRDIAALSAAHPVSIDRDDLRKTFEEAGIQHGPAFSGLAAVHLGDGPHRDGATLFAEVALPGSLRAQQAPYEVHPAVLDACFQSAMIHPGLPRAADGALPRPVGVRRLRRYHPTRAVRYCLSTLTAVAEQGCEIDLELLDATGTVLLTVEGLRLDTGSAHDAAERTLDERLLTIEWQRRERPDPAPGQSGNWLLLSMAAAADPLAAALQGALKDAGAQADTVAVPIDGAGPADALPEAVLNGRTGVVVVTPPAIEDADPQRRGRDFVTYLLSVVHRLAGLSGQAPRLYLVTRAAATVRPGDRANLEQAGLRGLVRVIDSEHPHLKVTQIDVVDDGTQPDTARAAGIAAQLCSGSEEDETAWRDGAWYTARLRSAPLGLAERRTTVVEHGSDGIRLAFGEPDEIESLESIAQPRITPGPGQIEVAVAVSGVNYAQAPATERPAAEEYSRQLGTDFAGVVSAVGPDVTGHRVGDHVGGIAPDGGWSTFITCDARSAVTLPAALSPAEAAALSTAYVTAWYALHDLARIAAGDKVLIQVAGGIGRAAIAVAQAAGCEVFATADSPQQRQRLRDMGINGVYDSATPEFADRIRHDTGGYGVDVVLNSLSGIAQRAGLDLLSFGGRFIELGRPDGSRQTWLGLSPFRRNLSLHVVDLALLAQSHPEVVHRLLATVYQRAADGTLPRPQTTHYPLLDAADALRHDGDGDRAGTALLVAPQTGESVAVIPPEQARPFRADGAYIVTGGTGGAGLFLATEMAAAGCGRLVLNGTSAPDGPAQQAIERMRAAGADVRVECGDIAEPATAQRLVAVATETGLPVRGVLHAVTAAENAALADLTDAVIDRCWTPKVHGAWNIHQALREETADTPLDWFCAFSSTSALIGSPGQGAAAAADSWLDAFGRWRRSRGLPATVIGWGPWADTGTAVAPADGDAHAAITSTEGARVFQAMLSYDRAYSGYAPITRAPGLTALAHRSRFAEQFRATRRSGPDAERFLAELRELPRDEWFGAISQLVSDQISVLLRRTVDPDRSLPEYGLDSLASLEFRTRIETETGVRVGPAQLTTVRGLARHVCDELVSRTEGAESRAGR